FFKSAPSVNVGTTLQGTVTGLRVSQTTGNPGTSPSITFRGGTDFTGTGSPLVILDGAIVANLYGINMDDIERIDVLKDAGSTAIYGARAANGVIVLTTKHGKRGRPQVTYSYRNANNLVRRDPLKMLSAKDYLTMNRRGIGSRYEADVLDGNVANQNADITQNNSGAYGWTLAPAWTAANGIFSNQLVTDNNRSLIGQPGWNLLVDPNPFNAAKTDSILFRSISQRQLEDLFLQKSTEQQHYVNFSGAGDQGAFSLGLGAVDDKGMVVGSSYKRFSANFNGSLNVSKYLKIGMNAAGYSLTATPSYFSADGGNSVGITNRVFAIAPTIRFTNDTSGAILPGAGTSLGNPAYFRNIYYDKTGDQRFSGSINLDYTILPSLHFTASGSGYMRYTTDNVFTKAYYASNTSTQTTTRPASFSNTNDVQYSYNAFLTYNHAFHDHHVSVMGGAEFYDFKEYVSSGAATGAATDDIPWLVASSTVSSASSDQPAWDRLASLIGRVTYNYKYKYLLNVNLRYDGSSRFKVNTYGLFPGISAGWNVHMEDFFRRSGISKYVSVLKPRLSFGQNGSMTFLGSSYFPTSQVYGSGSIYNGAASFYAGSLTNTALKWEKSSTLNMGLDLGLFQDRVLLIGDYFVRNVYDKLATLTIPAWTGFSTYTTNLGQLQNRGVELELKVKILQAKQPGGLTWDFGVNFSTVKSYVIKLPPNGQPNNRESASSGTALVQVWDPAHAGQLRYVGGLQEGHRVGTDEVWAPKWDGIYTSQAALDKDAGVYNAYNNYTHHTVKLMGDAKWHQVYQNDTIDSRQFVYVGRTTPQYTGGFSTTLNWKGFTLYGQFDYALDFVISNQIKLLGLSQAAGGQNSSVDLLKTWSPDNPNGTMPRFYWANSSGNYITSANIYEKGDYLAVRELTLSYELSSALVSKALNNRIHGLRVYVTGTNLTYFTGYSGNLPETGGADAGRYALPRTVTFGLNLNL
ncbi:MAG: SusC/RagA family TonB-linked outer membrane protein, partial [Chitinophaga rupis]